MLSAAFWTILPEIFTCGCAMLPHKNSDNKKNDFFLSNVVLSLKDNIT